MDESKGLKSVELKVRTIKNNSGREITEIVGGAEALRS